MEFSELLSAGIYQLDRQHFTTRAVASPSVQATLDSIHAESVGRINACVTAEELVGVLTSLGLFSQAEYDAKQAAEASAQAVSEGDRVAALWNAAHEYEYAQISGSAIGLLTMGVLQGLPKCLAVQGWIKSIWTLYYERKVGTSTDYSFDVVGECPFSVPDLMAELQV